MEIKKSRKKDFYFYDYANFFTPPHMVEKIYFHTMHK